MIATNVTSAVGGWNISDPYDNMEPQYAVEMDNIIPYPEGDVLRKGYVQKVNDKSFAQALSININGGEKLVCANSSELAIYDIDHFTDSPTVKTGFSSEKWLNAHFADGSGNPHVFFANGADKPQDYTTSGGMQDTTLTIPDGVKLSCPLAFKNRLYFIGGDFRLYYTGIQSIAGTITAFDMGSYFKKGGKVIGIANWTQDAGNGIDDLFVIISSEGEVMIYAGTDPESDDWNTLGVFQIPKPIGNKCYANFGGDLIVITERGYFPLSNVLSNLRANRSGICQKIDGITKGRDTSKNWSIHFSPKRGWLIVNVPSLLAGYAYEQHVLNLATNAWCRFVGMNASGWAEVKDRLFFVNGGGVYEADVGDNDNGDFLIFNVQRAYNTFGLALKKQLMEIDPRYYTETSSKIELYKRIDVDFKQGQYRKMTASSQAGYYSEWDKAIWDQSYWSDEFSAYQFRGRVSSRPGNFISIGFYGRSKTSFSFYSFAAILKECNGHI